MWIRSSRASVFALPLRPIRGLRDRSSSISYLTCSTNTTLWPTASQNYRSTCVSPNSLKLLFFRKPRHRSTKDQARTPEHRITKRATDTSDECRSILAQQNHSNPTSKDWTANQLATRPSSPLIVLDQTVVTSKALSVTHKKQNSTTDTALDVWPAASV